MPPAEFPPASEIEALPWPQRLDAIATEIWGPPRAEGSPWGKPNHTVRLAELIGVTPRRIRQIRRELDETGTTSPKILSRITAEWKLWRRKQSDNKATRRRRQRDKVKAERLRAIREKGPAALGIVGRPR